MLPPSPLHLFAAPAGAVGTVTGGETGLVPATPVYVAWPGAVEGTVSPLPEAAGAVEGTVTATGGVLRARKSERFVCARACP